MALPKQVEAQLREVEEIERQLSGEESPPAQESDPASAEPQQESNKSQPEQAEATETSTPVEPEVPEETWQQKYRTLKGMYDAEVPRLHTQVKELTKRLDQIQNAKPEPKPEVKEPKQSLKLVTDEDVKEFGADLIEVQRKVAREVAMEFTDEIEVLRAQNEELRKQVSATGAQVTESSFEQRLYRKVPDFEQLNRDPKWIEWLNEIDPIIRGPRMSVAQSAYERGDVDAVAHYVNLFRQTQAPTTVADKKRKEQELQIQPAKNSSANQSNQKQGKVYTDAEVGKMYQRVAELTMRGDSTAATKLEAEIDAAFRDGRVTA